MEIYNFHEELSGILQNLAVQAPGGSLLSLAGGEIRMMAQCYLEDGRYCMARDDPVNALASFAYAAGWLDTGCYIGILPSGPLCKNLLGGSTPIPDRFHPQLVEKSCRYQHLLDDAITASVPGSETGVHWYEGGDRVISVATAYLAGGKMFLRAERYVDALSCFSYGHGWLDTALRVGLTRIVGNRDLFAI